MTNESLGYVIIYNILFLALAAFGVLVFIKHAILYTIFPHEWQVFIALSLITYTILKLWHRIEVNASWLHQMEHKFTIDNEE